MNRLEKQLPSKANFSTSLQLNYSNFRLKWCGGLRDTKIVEEIKFEGFWGELEPRKGFQRQSVIKYSRLTIVFM